MTNNSISVALVGTSNSIMANAFSWPFQRSADVTFSNMSLGASCSANAAWAISKMDFSLYDFTLIDLCNNEEHQNTHGITSVERFSANLITLINACSEAGSVPVVISFPRLPYLDSARPIHDAAMSVARSLKVTTIDLYQFLENACAVDFCKIPAQDYFMDEAHLKRPVARAVGAEVIRTLQRIAGSGPKTRRAEILEHARTYYVPATIIPGASRAVRSTAIMSQDVTLLEAGVSVSAPFPCEGDLLTALHLNAARSDAGLRVAGVRVTGGSPESAEQPQKQLLSVIRPLRHLLPVSTRTDVQAIDEDPSGTTRIFELCGFVLQEARQRSDVCVSSYPLRITEMTDTFSARTLQQISMLALDS